MATITDFASLEAAMTAWLHHSDYASDYPTMIQLAEAEFNRRLRIRAMENSLSLTLTAGVATVALPASYVQMRVMYIDGSPKQPLNVVSLSQLLFETPQTTTGKPKFVATDGDNLRFGPIPDSAYSVLGTYYKAFSAVSSGVNWLITNAPDLYLFRSLVEVEPYMRAEANPTGVGSAQINRWLSRCEKIYSDLNSADAGDRYSGGPLVMRSDAGNP